MKIERLKIKNYKVFADTEINDLPSMCVFLGANGSGKSTLFDVFGFLSDALRTNVRTAIDSRGGFKEVISRDIGKKPIRIRNIYYALKEESWRINAMILVRHNIKMTSSFDEGLDRMVGSLLGYSDAENDEYQRSGKPGKI